MPAACCPKCSTMRCWDPGCKWKSCSLGPRHAPMSKCIRSVTLPTSLLIYAAIADSLPLPMQCHLLLYPCDLPLFRPFCRPCFDQLFVIGPAWVDCRKSLYTFSFVIFTFSTSASSAQILPPRQVTRLGGAHWLFARFHPSMFSIYLLTEPKVRPPANKLCLSYLNFQKWATAFFAFWKSLSP